MSYHVRRLHALGFLELVKRTPRRGAIEHHYRAKARPRVTDEGWAETPSIVKRAMVGASLQQITSYVNAAAGAGRLRPRRRATSADRRLRSTSTAGTARARDGQVDETRRADRGREPERVEGVRRGRRAAQAQRRRADAVRGRGRPRATTRRRDARRRPSSRPPLQPPLRARCAPWPPPPTWTDRSRRTIARTRRYTCRPRADVAQLARASACHAEGRGFESLHPLDPKARLGGPSSFPDRHCLRSGPGVCSPQSTTRKARRR